MRFISRRSPDLIFKISLINVVDSLSFPVIVTLLITFLEIASNDKFRVKALSFLKS